MPQAKGSAGPRVDTGSKTFPALRKLPVGAGGQGYRTQCGKHNPTTATRNGCRGGRGRRARVSPAWGWSEVRARSEKELSQAQDGYGAQAFILPAGLPSVERKLGTSTQGYGFRGGVELWNK